MGVFDHNKQKRWLRIFAGVSLLVLAQLIWWSVVFVRNVETIEQLKEQNLALRSQAIKESPLEGELRAVQKEAFHRRVMFLSESAFFGILICVGFYLLYRAIKAEQHSREIQANFIEVVSHESKTPLTALKLRLESLLDNDLIPQAALTENLQLAKLEVQRLSSILEKALNLNRLERHAMSFEELSLAEVVRDVIRRFEPLLKARGVVVEADLDADAWVWGDGYGLQNSVQSLVENSVQHNLKADKRIAIQVTKAEGKVRLVIEDNGPGISEVEKNKIFDRFFRGKTKASVPGTGLGLYLAKAIVEAHQGTLRLLDSTVKTGTSFEILLPEFKGNA